MKSVPAIVILCMLMTMLFAEPTFAATYKVNDGGKTTYVSEQRAAACDRMLEMSQVEWQLSGRLRYCFGQKDGVLDKDTKIDLYKWVDNKMANEVITRKGIPYTQVDREHSFPNGFTLTYGTKTTTIDGNTYRSIWGTDCSSSVDFAWRKGTGNLNSSNFMKHKDSSGNYHLYRTRHMFADGIVNKSNDGEGDYLMLVGKYGNYYSKRVNATTTREVVDELSKADNYAQTDAEVWADIYSKVYAAMKPGDALLWRGDTTGHVRLVTEVYIAYKNETKEGKKVVDPGKSYVKCIEQTGFKKGDANWKTSWIPNQEEKDEAGQDVFTGVYTFEQLAGKKRSPVVNPSETVDVGFRRYVPIKLKAFND